MDGENKARILLIDDDLEFCELVRDYMSLQNMPVDFRLTGGEGLKAANGASYDLILLDMMLPDISGLDVLRRLREACGVPVVIFSAHNDETDRIVALEMGADDYVPKSFSSRELLARVRAVLRRTASSAAPRQAGVLSLRGLDLNQNTMRLSCRGVSSELSYVEFQMLHALMREPGRIFSRDALLNLFADKEWNKLDRSVDVHISSLRKKIAGIAGPAVFIRTVRSMGYTFARQENE